MTATRRIDNHWLGLGYYLLCLVILVFISMIVKHTGERVPVFQILMFRFAFSLVPLWLIALRHRATFTLRTRRPGDHAVRTLVGICSIGLFFVAVDHIPLAAATSLSYAAPVFCAVLSIPILGELIGVRRWTAVIAGFIGVVVICWPGLAGNAPGDIAWHIGIPAAIGSAVGGALVNIYLRKLSDTENALTSSIFYNSTGTLVFLAWVGVAGWTPLAGPDLMLLVSLGLLAGVQQFSLATAFRYAEASYLTPFEYLILVLAAAAGYFVWGEIPETTTWFGGVIIAGSGLFMLHRQQVKGGRVASR